MARHISDDEPEPLEFIEPWHCGSCGEFIYNKDQEGYPAPGAPIGVSVRLEEDEQLRVCLVCAEMYITVLKSSHLREQHNLWKKELAYKNKLKTGSNYLDR